MIKKKILLMILLSAVMFNCSTVNTLYIKNGYMDKPDKMIKRVIVVVDSSKECSEIRPLMLNIVKDVLELKKNYLVYKSSTENMPDIICGEINKESNIKIDGAIKFTLDYARVKDDIVDICIKGNLLQCSIEGPQWNAIADDECRSGNDDLRNLTAVYREKYGSIAEIYAAPVFTLIQDLVKTMPNPILSDDEEMEKIELETFEESSLEFFKHLALFDMNFKELGK